MAAWFSHRSYGPIGIDIGSRSVKLVQLDRAGARLLEAARWDLPAAADNSPAPAARRDQLADALRRAREGRKFKGREAIVCLSARELSVQNVRVAKASGAELDKLVRHEVASRLPYPVAESELRYIEAGDVRQGETAKREVIVLASHRPKLDALLQAVEVAGLKAVAVDAEPTALLRCYVRQFRRDDDRTQRAIFVHVGAANTIVVIARGAEVVFVKYIDAGGRQMDEAVAADLQMDMNAASALRRHNGDRRADQQDPEVAKSVQEAVRGVVDRLVQELSLCMRYHSVTFRGQPLSRLVLGGGEASTALLETIASRIDVKCELGDPLRLLDTALPPQRRGQWDLATGLALRSISA